MLDVKLEFHKLLSRVFVFLNGENCFETKAAVFKRINIQIVGICLLLKLKSKICVSHDKFKYILNHHCKLVLISKDQLSARYFLLQNAYLMDTNIQSNLNKPNHQLSLYCFDG